jgi:DNA invertase Pin-like site-specific DNA recombinase
MLLKAPSMTKIGYARVSSFDQDPHDAAGGPQGGRMRNRRKAKASGKSRAVRDELAAILEFVRPGDRKDRSLHDDDRN